MPEEPGQWEPGQWFSRLSRNKRAQEGHSLYYPQEGSRKAIQEPARGITRGRTRKAIQGPQRLSGLSKAGGVPGIAAHHPGLAPSPYTVRRETTTRPHTYLLLALRARLIMPRDGKQPIIPSRGIIVPARFARLLSDRPCKQGMRVH